MTRHVASRQGPLVLVVLAFLMAFASISTDVYLPAMPVMARSLGAQEGVIEWTVTGYLIGFCLGQLFWGPISDRIGRRMPVMFGIVIFILGSVGCALADSATTIILARLVQAIGASAAVVLARTMIGDLYEGPRAAQMMSMLMTVMAVAPLLGPIIGGQILLFGNWQAIFWALAGIGLVALLGLILLPETLAPHKRSQEGPVRAILSYRSLLFHHRFLCYAGAGGFFYGGMFAYFAGTPAAYITYHHVPAQLYGVLFAIGILGLVGANLVNVRLVPRYGVDRMLTLGTLLAAAAGLSAALNTKTDWGGLWGLVISLFFYVTAAGFIVANSVTGAIKAFPHRAGSSSALVGAMQYGFGIFGSGLVGAMADGTPWPMGLVLAVAGVASLVCSMLISAIGRM